MITATGFDRRALDALPQGSPSTVAIRERAFDLFASTPMPSQETEEWRYTDLGDFALDFTPFAGSAGRVNDLDEVPGFLLAAAGDLGERSGLAIQHNSEIVLTHLDPVLESRGVRLLDLDVAAAEQPELVDRYLHALVSTDRTRFTALHDAFRTGGTFLYVPPDVRVEFPIQSVTYLDAEGAAVFPRTLLIADRGAEVTFIDRYHSPDLGRALSDAVVEVFAEQGAHVRYVALQEWGGGVTHLAVQRMQVGRDARIQSLGVAFGGSLARAEIESVLSGDGGSSELLGLYFGDHDQHIDHRSIQNHVGSRTSSDLLYKGALKDASNATYTGTVIIEQGAHLCDAYQTNRNILLSERAKAHTVPNLEILSNDPTRCGHAASVGPVSDDELFYVMSRGIPAKEAERLIVFGFFNEVLDRVGLPEIRASLESTISAELES